MPKDVIVLSPKQRDAISTKLSATIQTTQKDKTILFIGMVSICYDTEIMIQYMQIGWVKSVLTHKQNAIVLVENPTASWVASNFRPIGITQQNIFSVLVSSVSYAILMTIFTPEIQV